MGAQFWRSRSAILRFFVIFEKAKKTVFRQGRFFTFFHHFWCLLGGLLALFWRPFGVSVVSLACRCPPFGCLFTFFVFLGVTLKIAVLPAWELNSGDCWCLLGGLLALFWRPFGVSVVSLACRCFLLVVFFYVFCVFGGHLEIAVLPAWELIFHDFWCFLVSLLGPLLGAFWQAGWLAGCGRDQLLRNCLVQWLSLARPSRPWALSATFCGVFGSSGLFLGLGDRSGTIFYFIFGSCWVHFLKIRGG
jgi:hypothetical protein